MKLGYCFAYVKKDRTILQSPLGPCLPLALIVVPPMLRRLHLYVRAC